MNAKEIFRLAVRLLGLVFLYHGLIRVPTVFSIVVNSVPSFSLGNTLVGLFMAAWPLFVAYWLLRGAPLIMQTAYPDSPHDQKTETQIGGALGRKADA
jgi:hypothetical protein